MFTVLSLIEILQVYITASDVNDFQIHEVIRQLHMKMDEIIGRQERTLGLVSAVHSGMGELSLIVVLM